MSKTTIESQVEEAKLKMVTEAMTSKKSLTEVLTEILTTQKEELVKTVRSHVLDFPNILLHERPSTDTYIDLVKNGNKDQMFDYGVEMGKKDVLKSLTHLQD